MRAIHSQLTSSGLGSALPARLGVGNGKPANALRPVESRILDFRFGLCMLWRRLCHPQNEISSCLPPSDLWALTLNPDYHASSVTCVPGPSRTAVGRTRLRRRSKGSAER